MAFSDEIKLGEIKIKEPQNTQEWMRQVLRIVLDSGNGSRTPTRVKEKDLPRSTTRKEGEYVKQRQ